MAGATVNLTTTAKVVRRHIGNRPPRRITMGRRAAVSIVLFEEADATKFVLIERANRGRNAGQWALPGGKLEVGETEQEAALREAQEEVGLPASAVKVLGQLDQFGTATGFAVSTFVVLAPAGWTPRAAADEVHAIHVFELSALISDDVVHWAAQPDGTRLLQMRLRDDAHLHAPTGAILLQFRDLALFGREVDVTALLQPAFTHD